MKRCFIILATLIVGALSYGCVSSSGPSLKDANINKVALVSLSVSDWGGSVQAGSIGSTQVSELIDSTVNQMRLDTEKQLATKWQVLKTEDFIANPAYKKSGVEKTLKVYVPKIDGQPMQVFTQVSKEIKHGDLSPIKAQELCQALDTDAIVLMFSEWTSRTGSLVPTTKALTKNIFAIWDKNGRKLAMRRVDMTGKRTLGFGGFKAVNQETINEWRDTYNRSLTKILQSL